jgi:recombinational DNA repair protein RecT
MEEKKSVQIMTLIQNTNALAVAELEPVKEKFISNYNLCHKAQIGELMYHRQVVHFKQAIAASDQLKACDTFSLYACFVTAAVNGYSLDSQDNEVYLIPLKGKAVLWRQAGAHVRRLQRTNQVQYAEQPKLVYKGDIFEVENGRVVKHVEKFETEEFIAGYVRFVVDEKGNDRFFIYRKSDWEAWRKKSQMPNGENWNGNNGQPVAAFLRTKIVKHACTEKCWATGITNPQSEQFSVEVDADDKRELETTTVDQPAVYANENGNGHSKETTAAHIQMTQHEPSNNGTVVHEDAGEDW